MRIDRNAISLLGCLSAVAAFCGALVLGAAPAAGDPAEREWEQMRRGEYLVPFANGCARIVELPRGLSLTHEQLIEFSRKETWAGGCRAGLAHGQVGQTRFILGRVSPYYWVYTPGPEDRARGHQSWRRFADGLGNDGLHLTLFGDGGSLDQPAALTRPPTAALAVVGISRRSQGTAITIRQSCYPHELAEFPQQDQATARRLCRGSDRTGVYNFHVNGPPGDGGQRFYLCRTPSDWRTCADTWRQAILPGLAEFEPIVRNAQSEDARWAAEREAMVSMAERDFAARRLAAEQAEADRRARAAAARAEASERRAAEEAAFQRTLETGSAGALYAQADTLLEEGRTDEARQTLRALLRRFPDNALAARAADRLAQMSAPSPPQSSAPAARAPSGGQSSAAGAASSGGVSCAGTPRQHMDSAFNRAVDAIAARCPQRPGWGSRAEMQRLYWVMNESLKVLEAHRQCMGPLYQDNYAAITAARDQARTACNQLASGSGSCPNACP